MEHNPSGQLYLIIGVAIRALLDSGEPADEVRRGTELAIKASTVTSPVAEAAGKAYAEIITDEVNKLE